MLKIKKYLSIIFVAFYIFQLVVMAATIDIGSAATDRGSTMSQNITRINKNTSATGTGTITLVKIYVAAQIDSLVVGTCYLVSGTTFTTRDSEIIIGGANIATGYHEYEVELDVILGDYITLCFNTGTVETDTTGGAGVWWVGGQIVPFADTEFTFADDYIMSFCGTGATEAGTTILFTMSDF